MTDALKLIAENTAKGRGGRYPSRRFADLAAPPKRAATDRRSGDEIAADIIGRLAGR